MLRDDINNAVKDAMKAKDERKLSTLRMVNSTIKNADIAARGEGKPPLIVEKSNPPPGAPTSLSRTPSISTSTSSISLPRKCTPVVDPGAPVRSHVSPGTRLSERVRSAPCTRSRSSRLTIVTAAASRSVGSITPVAIAVSGAGATSGAGWASSGGGKSSATGLAAAGYGFGAIFTSFPIDSMIKSAGYAHTLMVWGIIQAAIGVVAAQGLRIPPDGWQPSGYAPATATTMQSKRSYTPAQMLQSPIFWLLFLMMSMMSTSGLMVVSNVGPFAKEYSVADTLVLGMAALPLSLTLSRLTNGMTRPFFGWVSDHIGREMTMALAFSLECAAILVLFAFIDQPALFVVLTGLVFFGWGEIFSLFPATLTDTFGPKYAATNYGFLYIAQGVGSILGGPAAAFLKQTTGSWTAVFITVAVLDALTALLAITALRTLRSRHLQTS